MAGHPATQALRWLGIVRRHLVLLSVTTLLIGPTVAGAGSNPPTPTLAGCPVFPADSAWNQRVDGLPVAKNSARTVARIGLSSPVHPDFGTVYNGAPNGIPYAVVSAATGKVRVRFTYASESDRAPIHCRVASRSRAGHVERRSSRDRR